MPKSSTSACVICGGQPTIRSHLIPSASAHDLRGSHKHVFVGSASRPGKRIVQSGLIDTTILCAAHDGHLGKYDGYGIEFCRTFPAKHRLVDRDAWEVAGVDGDMLTRFFISMLWRYSISNLPEAQGVNVGPFEPMLRDILFNGASCAITPETILLRYRARLIAPEGVCFPPYETKFPDLGAGVSDGYGIAVSGLHAFIRLDRSVLPPAAHQITINGKATINGGFLELEQTNQFKAMVQIAGNMARG